MPPVQLFFLLLSAGIILIAMEVFIPGGILGTIGGLALVGAVITSFVAFPPSVGLYIAIGIVLLLGVVLGLWIKYFPGTRFGRKMAVLEDLSGSKATETGIEALVGKEGIAASNLHPAGFATIDGRRVDVVSQGQMISKGESIRVVEVEGNRVVVARAG